MTPYRRLDRGRVTAASRVMLPTYVAAFAAVGGNWTFAPLPRLLASPTLRYADSVAPLRAWGLLFLACSTLMVAALVAHRREWFRFALTVCGLAMGAFAAVAAVGTVAEPVSFSAWVWPAVVSTACFASDRSLLRGERDPGRD